MIDAQRRPPPPSRPVMHRPAIEMLRPLLLSALLAIGLIGLLAALDLAATR